MGTFGGTSQDVHSFAPPVAYAPGLHGRGHADFSGQKSARGQRPLQSSLTNPGVAPYVPALQGLRTPFWQW